jgi:hypothetical protein
MANEIRNVGLNEHAAILADQAPAPKETRSTDELEGMPVRPLFTGGVTLRPNHAPDLRPAAIEGLRYSVFGVLEQMLSTSLDIEPVLTATTKDTDVLLHAAAGIMERDQLPVDPRVLDPWQYQTLSINDVAYTKAGLMGIQRFVMAFRLFMSGRVLTGHRLQGSRAQVATDHYELLRQTALFGQPHRYTAEDSTFISLRWLADAMWNSNALGQYRPIDTPEMPCTPIFDGVYEPYFNGRMDDVPLFMVPWLRHPVTHACNWISVKRHAGPMSDGKILPHNTLFGSDSYREAEGAAHGKNDVRAIQARLRLIEGQTKLVEAVTWAQCPIMYAVAARPDVERRLKYLQRTLQDRDKPRELALRALLAKIDWLADNILDGLFRDASAPPAYMAASSGFEATILTPYDQPAPADVATVGSYGLDSLAASAMETPTYQPNSPPPHGDPAYNDLYIDLAAAVHYLVCAFAGPQGEMSTEIHVNDQGTITLSLLKGLGYGKAWKRPVGEETPVACGVPAYTNGMTYSRRVINEVFRGLGTPIAPVVELALNTKTRGQELASVYRRSTNLDLATEVGVYRYGPDPSGPGATAPIATDGFRASYCGLFMAAVPRVESLATSVFGRVLPRIHSMGEHLERHRPTDVETRYDITDILTQEGFRLEPALLDREVHTYLPDPSLTAWCPDVTPGPLRTHIRAWLLWNETTRAAAITYEEPTAVPVGIEVHPGWVPFPAPEQVAPSDPAWSNTWAAREGELPWDRHQIASANVAFTMGLCTCQISGGRHLVLFSAGHSFFQQVGGDEISPHIRYRDRVWTAPTFNRPAIRSMSPGGWLVATGATRFARRQLIARRQELVGWRLAIEGALPFPQLMGVDIDGPIGMPKTNAYLTELREIAQSVLAVQALRSASITVDGAREPVAHAPPPGVTGGAAP